MDWAMRFWLEHLRIYYNALVIQDWHLSSVVIMSYPPNMLVWISQSRISCHASPLHHSVVDIEHHLVPFRNKQGTIVTMTKSLDWIKNCYLKHQVYKTILYDPSPSPTIELGWWSQNASWASTISHLPLKSNINHLPLELDMYHLLL